MHNAHTDPIGSMTRDANAIRPGAVTDERTTAFRTFAHEINAPLTPLRIQLHLLENEAFGPLTDQQREGVRILLRSAARVQRLTRQMLEVARQEAGVGASARRPVDVGILLQESVLAYAAAAKQAGVTLESDCREGLLVFGDHATLPQVFDNLVANAIKYTPPGGVVLVHAARQADQVEILVQDTGIGLGDAQVTALFQPFSRVHAADNEREGTGLGLSICKSIVEQHEGTIGGTSPGPGQGTRMRIRLPAYARIGIANGAGGRSPST